ncbi:3-hydroxyacyl-CoA dehydrogenase family protein [Nisaea acidiphila]|uniref:3-hydroxyacyl-CoA dehydrogenase family protein n=1 Tax=Nisaea acidiphila TaxID=1862145 RepID=A0A9J7AYY6_9PROT|nr:3-hydroxyacyl-CoA dehydrogenase family protein [Nisaea acidiphila]UUX52002.1 3-hydroxyacyl-CoA dehydrogenase family protein [Nisaea acidiphila]
MSVNKIGVIGAGMMGSEIALVFAMAGKDVMIMEPEQARLDKAEAGIRKTLEGGVARKFWAEEDMATALGNITMVTDLSAYGDRDLVIEAVFEDEKVKAEVYKTLDEVCKDDAIIASNTSSISISVLASYFSEKRQSRFLGLHFFSPVSRMKLVEVIRGMDTDDAVIDAARNACVEAGKTPIDVKDVVGFAVNRILFAMWDEVLRLVEEGACTPEDIDTGCKLGLGHPVGPFELMDNISNTLNLQVAEILHEAYGERFHPRPILRQVVAAGRAGRRAGRGWYRYDEKGKRIA